MKNRITIALVVITFALLLVLGAYHRTAAAQSGGAYDLTWNVIASGGTITGGAYTLSSAIGQAEAATLSGGIYSLGVGVWGGGKNPLVPGIYLPMIVR